MSNPKIPQLPASLWLVNPSEPFVADHEHFKGGLYRKVAYAIRESDLASMVIYEDAEGRIWIRPADEFNARFTGLNGQFCNDEG